MGASNEEVVRRLAEVLNTSESVEEAIATGVEELWDPEIEFVNPDDAIERGTRRGVDGMRTVLENFIEGAGSAATIELEELEERNDRVFVRYRVHARGASGAEAVGPPVAMVYTFRDGRVLRIEWHYDVAKGRARFEDDLSNQA
jgi:ketosteroid isomerase-like protein